MLLLFKRGASSAGIAFPEGMIPPHDGSGPAHVAFAVDADSLGAWEAKLDAAGITVESRITWRRGGSSIYVRDPEGHSLELARRRLQQIVGDAK